MSKGRLEEFMRAERNYFAQKDPLPIKTSQIVSVTTPLDVAKLVHEELPTRFAHRMKLMESLENWEACEELVRLYEVFEQSFKDLRLAEPSADKLAEYIEVIRSLRVRHSEVPRLLGLAIQNLYRQGFMNEKSLNDWVDKFMASRMATEMLTAHCMAVYEANEDANLESWWGPSLIAPENPTGIVDVSCDPAQIVEAAARSVQNSMKTPWENVPVQIEVQKAASDNKIGFCYISKYLFFVLEELLTNAARAVLQRCRSKMQLERSVIKVTVSADQKNVAISICDKGGGIPSANIDDIWSYAYSSSAEPLEPHEGRSPLGGHGMGLPLARLYVRYLGGELDVMNMPGIGVDQYLKLNRIEISNNPETDAVGRPPSSDTV